jgi:hypothetical protein
VIGAALRGRWRTVLRAAAPMACAAAVIGLLAGWVETGAGGTISRVQLEVTFAAIPVPAPYGTAAGGRAAGGEAAGGEAGGGLTWAYLTIRNFSGRAFVLTGASCPEAQRVTVTGPPGQTGTGGPGTAGAGAAGAGTASARNAGARTAGAGTAGAATAGAVGAGLVIPAHSTVTLSPFGSDIELAGARLLRAGEHVPLTLVFGRAGRVTIEVTVTAPGTP